jgi:hypothetical protein
MEETPRGSLAKKERRRRAVASAALESGELVELVFDPQRKETALAISKDGATRVVPSYEVGGEILVPYSAQHSLLETGVVLLPSAVGEAGGYADLLEAIRTYLRRYVAVTPRFERIASHYVLLTWVHDRFNELPYLRLRGDYGTGKTRFLLTVGALCYRPIFASGASTVAPIFHSIHAFRGTLIIDEADFRASDERADIVKILNNGNVRGLRVLRMEVNAKGEYRPRAYEVFGPKLVAMRGVYDDRALESRFITEDMTGGPLRDDIPINLSDSHYAEALVLRNRLLSFRFQNWARVGPRVAEFNPEVEPRLRQIFGPLLALAEDRESRLEIAEIAREYQEDLIVERGLRVEAQLLEILRDLFVDGSGLGVPIGQVAQALVDRYGSDTGQHVTPRWVGSVVRKQLGLRTRKSHGVFIIPFTERERLGILAARYGLDNEDAGRADRVRGLDTDDGGDEQSTSEHASGL